MSLRPGDLLKDQSGEARFRIKDLLEEGRSYYVALGEDTHLDNMRVVLKAIRYSQERPSAEELQERRQSLQLELEALTLPSPLLPEPVDWLEVPSDLPTGAATEPVLVQEFISGRTLRQEVARAEGGLEPARALHMIHELALALDEMHEHGFVFRDLNPDHIIVGYDDIIHLVGAGNMTRIGQRPLMHKESVCQRYSAPEIRSELSGKFLGARSDIYSLGALLAFLLTGVDPIDQVEAPLDKEGYQRLKALPLGYQLLVARCLQPMGKNRPKNIQALLPWLHPQQLPTAQSKGFQGQALPEPFDLNRPDNRATRSKLSKGPLVSEPRKPPVQSDQQAEQGAIIKRPDNSPQPWYKSCLPWAAMLVLSTTAGLGGLAWWAL